MKKRIKKLVLADYDKLFNKENVITNPSPVNTNKKFTDDGIYSERVFGKYNDDDGKKPIDTLGWIELPYTVINPIMYYIIKKCIKNLPKIINYSENIEVLEEKEQYEYIGIIEFRKHFKEILDYSVDMEKNSADYKFILNNMDKVFIDKIPLFSHKLRPATMVGKTLMFDKINNFYNIILNYIDEINDKAVDIKEVEIGTNLTLYPLLFNIQMYCNKIFNYIISTFLKGKKGFLRKNVLGARLNWVGRCVIGPLVGYEMNEVAIPYLTFAELWKFQLINLISKVKNINYNQALEFWDNNTRHFSPELYSYMQELIDKTKDGCSILLNRNPTISIGSILFLKIAYVKKDYNDLTLSISNNILQSLTADYDGDCLNIIAIHDCQLKEAFEKLSPNNFVIDRNNGKFNKDFNLYKDQILGIYLLNN